MDKKLWADLLQPNLKLWEAPPFSNIMIVFVFAKINPSGEGFKMVIQCI